MSKTKLTAHALLGLFALFMHEFFFVTFMKTGSWIELAGAVSLYAVSGACLLLFLHETCTALNRPFFSSPRWSSVGVSFLAIFNISGALCSLFITNPWRLASLAGLIMGWTVAAAFTFWHERLGLELREYALQMNRRLIQSLETKRSP